MADPLTTPMTPPHLTKDEIRAGLELCEKAHPGPYAPKYDTLIVGPHQKIEGDIELLGMGSDQATRELFIQARTLLPRALSDLKRLLAEKAALVEENGRMRRGLEGIRNAADGYRFDAHWQGQDHLFEAAKSVARMFATMAASALTPTPAVEDKARCETCGGTGETMVPKVTRSGHHTEGLGTCPDCTTSEAKANEEEKA